MISPLPPDAKIALLSPSGWGNLGDAAIVESLVHGVRRRLPAARLVAFTLNAEGTAREHGLDAFTLLGFSSHLYVMRDAALPSDGVPSRAARALRRLPIPSAVRSAVRVGLHAFGELRHVRASRSRIEGASAVVVAGGGQLDDFFGGPWAQPYALLRWSVLARSVGARFIVASVGTGTLSPVSRWLVLRALARADYRSYRDDGSRELLGAPDLTRADPTVPDLAYALPVITRAPPGGPRLRIGLGPMAYCDPGQWPVGDQERYRRHVASFGALAAALLAEGHEVAIFTTDHEPGAIEDTIRALGALGPEAVRRLTRSSPADLSSLLAFYAHVDVVVAARLHGALLAHVAGRPVLAISHERKVRTLMAEAGQSRYCFDIDSFESQEGLARLRELVAAREVASTVIAAHVADSRARVEDQYDALFGPVVGR